VTPIHKLDDHKPIYIQIKERIEDAILDGTIESEGRIPSTNELAKFYNINPATARQGVNELVQEGIVTKRRGVGMFVSEEGKKIILEKRKEQFYKKYIVPLKEEAHKLSISEEQLVEMIVKGGEKGES